jgi:hypothetical protein
MLWLQELAKDWEKPLLQNWPNEKLLPELGIKYRSIDQAIADAVEHFTFSSNYSQKKKLNQTMNRILLFLCILQCSFGFTQSADTTFKKTQHFILSGSIGHGNVLPTNPFVKGENLHLKPIDQFRYASIKALWQNPAYTFWQQVHRMPYYGFGCTYSDFYNKEEIGTPLSMYGILGLPLQRWQWLELFTEFQFGIASNWNHYDSINNPKNIVIGGGLTIHLDIAMKAQFNLGP